jgi:Flp pilus assembly protein TadG
MALFLLAGLIIDSSRVLDARSRATAYAEEAARAGAMQIDLNTPGISYTATPDAVAAAVTNFCTTIRAREPTLTDCGPTAVTGERVSVRVRLRIPAAVLSVVGVDTFTVTGTASARSVQGVTGPNRYPGLPTPTVSISKVPLPPGLPTGQPNLSPTDTAPPKTTTTTPPRTSTTGTPGSSQTTSGPSRTSSPSRTPSTTTS